MLKESLRHDSSPLFKLYLTNVSKDESIEIEGTISHCVVHSEVHSTVSFLSLATFLLAPTSVRQGESNVFGAHYSSMYFLELSLTMGGGENSLLNELMAVRQVAVKPDK